MQNEVVKTEEKMLWICEYARIPPKSCMEDCNTWHEVAVPGEGIIGANITVNQTHDSDLGISHFCC